MKYRLLNEGEEIREGDEYYYMGTLGPNDWHPAPNYFNPVGRGGIYRRPIESGWIKLSERKPTIEDADEHNFVLIRAEWDDDRTIQTYLEDIARLNGSMYTQARHRFWWHPPPKFTPRKDEDEEAFENWDKMQSHSVYESMIDTSYHVAKRAWDAALQYARKK